MVLAFCRRGLVIPICLYLLVGGYMKEGISGLKNESSKTKTCFLNKLQIFVFIVSLEGTRFKSLEIHVTPIQVRGIHIREESLAWISS